MEHISDIIKRDPVLVPLLPPEKPEIDLSAILPTRANRGIYAYYGRLGQGKTYAMTADVIHLLRRGEVVYTNYPVKWDGYAETKSLSQLLFGVLGLRRKFFEYLPTNLRRIEVDEKFHENLAKITDASVALDEAYVVFDSYQMAKMSMLDRKNVLHTRHFDRSIFYTTQRPTNIHAVMRGNTNVFYKCSVLLKWPWLIFVRDEYDLASDESVDEDNRISRKVYFARTSIFRAYSTKYLRGNLEKKNPDVRIIHLKYLDIWKSLITEIIKKLRRNVL